MLNHTEIAAIAHEQNRIYCLSLDDDSQDHWEEAEDWQRQSAENGVAAIADGTIKTAQDSHKNWLAEKEKDGWMYAETKSAAAKLHPCIMPFSDLPKDQQFKDQLFFHTVRLLLKLSSAHA